MILKSQRRIASDLLKVGRNRILFDPNRLDEIKEAITKTDIRSLIKDKAIQSKPKTGVSRFRARKIIIQKRKGRKKGTGSRKGKRTARLSRKREWVNNVRTQRDLILQLKNKKSITPQTYRIMYRRIKGGFFRSRRHIRLYLTEGGFIKKNEKK